MGGASGVGGEAGGGCCHLTLLLTTSLTFLLSSPVLIFSGCVFIFFYHVTCFGIVSGWFTFLPYAFFSCALINFTASLLLPLHQAVSPCRLVQVLALGALVASFLLNGVAGYGCVELQSIVLQQAFLAVPISQVRPVQRCVVR